MKDTHLKCVSNLGPLDQQKCLTYSPIRAPIFVKPTRVERSIAVQLQFRVCKWVHVRWVRVCTVVHLKHLFRLVEGLGHT